MSRILLFLSCVWLLSHCQPSSVSMSADSGDLLPDLSSFPRDSLRLLIDKSDYQLQLIADTLVWATWPVVFGGNPVDDKLRQGDRCTPEGRFRVKSKRIHDKWSRFIWIDYPTPDSWQKHLAAKAEGKIPDHAGIGGEIGIHGVPSGYDAAIDDRSNWTLGCISLKNADVEALYAYVFEGMEVEIRP